MLMNVGKTPIESSQGLITTIAWGMDGKVEYALEGSVFSAGSTVQWLRDGLNIIETAKESEEVANTVEDNGGVYMVPAFSGMGAPYWEDKMHCSFLGITRGTTKGHMVRAALESIAYQTKDVLVAMSKDSGIELKRLRVDGGASENNLLMQFQSDLLNCFVERDSMVETTALGAAFLAGLAIGFWKDKEELAQLDIVEKVFQPKMEKETREKLYENWKKAVKTTSTYI